MFIRTSEMTPEFVDILGRAVAHHVTLERQSFDAEIKDLLEEHHRRIVGVFDARRGQQATNASTNHEDDMLCQVAQDLKPYLLSSAGGQEASDVDDVPIDLDSWAAKPGPSKLQTSMGFERAASAVRILDQGIEGFEDAKELGNRISWNGSVTVDSTGGIRTPTPRSSTSEKNAQRIGSSRSTRATPIYMISQASTGRMTMSVVDRFKSIRMTSFAQNPCRVERLRWWQDLDEPTSSVYAYRYSIMMNILIFTSVFLSVFSKFDPPLFPGGKWLGITQMILDFVFALELVARFYLSYSKMQFILDPYNVIDFIASIPNLIADASEGFVDVRTDDSSLLKQLVRGLGPVFKVCKILRRFPTFQLLISAFSDAMEALPVLMFVFILIGLTFASLLFVVERFYQQEPVNESCIQTFQQAIWLTVITMTTVGYGDYSPKTNSGRVLVGILVVVQVLYMALPLGILGHEFTNIWCQRHRFLAIKRVRSRMNTLGLGFYDIPTLFRQFGGEDGAINWESFGNLCKDLGVEMKERQLRDLYRSFDHDMGGTIDSLEFAQAVFPKQYIVKLDKRSEEGRSTVGSRASSFWDA